MSEIKATKKQRKQWYFNAKAKKIDITLWENCGVVLHEKEAAKHGITTLDKVTLFFKDKKTGKQRKVSVNANLTNELVRPWSIGILQDTHEKYKINHGEIIGIQYTKRSEKSVLAIKKKLLWKKLSKSEVKAIIKDITENKLSKTMLAYYVATSFLHEEDENELFWSTKYSAQYGEKLDFGAGNGEIVADKHCIGGVPGNETTMILIPIIASLWIKIPKSFSKAITSPAATGECVEVLMGIKNNKQEIYETVDKTGGCLTWGGGLALAPANNAIMDVTFPIAMEPYSKMVSSITAKKYAMGVSHCLIDIPVGPTAKVEQEEADKIAYYFKMLAEKLGMKMKVVFTEAEQPIGQWIGAVLQAREAIDILQQYPERSHELEAKAIFLASEIIELAGLAKGKDARNLAGEQLKNWKAWKKFLEIAEIQNSFQDKKIESPYYTGEIENLSHEKFILAKYQQDVIIEKPLFLEKIDMKKLGSISRTLWCPLDYQSGIYLHHRLWAKLEHWEVLMTLYSNDAFKLQQALERLKTEHIYN